MSQSNKIHHEGTKDTKKSGNDIIVFVPLVLWTGFALSASRVLLLFFVIFVPSW